MEPPSALSHGLLRSLSDKIYERRKGAALELESLVRDLFEQREYEQIKLITSYLVREFAFSHFTQAKNGGLIGLAAIAIALGPEVDDYLDDIIPPVLACFSDPEVRVRYYACESMYNIAKVAKGDILRFFNEIFDALSRLVSDVDTATKKGALLLDRLMKDIIAEQNWVPLKYNMDGKLEIELKEEEIYFNSKNSMKNANNIKATFSIPRFIPLLSERIKTKDTLTRSFLVDWLTVLNGIPDIELACYLPKFQRGLMLFLADPNPELVASTSLLFADFLRDIRDAANHLDEISKEKKIKKDNKDDEIDQKDNLEDSMKGTSKGEWKAGQGVTIDYRLILEILIEHLSSNEEAIQALALKWIQEFSEFTKSTVMAMMPNLVKALLPCLAHPNPKILNLAIESNSSLYYLVLESKFVPSRENSKENWVIDLNDSNNFKDSSALKLDLNKDNDEKTSLKKEEEVSTIANDDIKGFHYLDYSNLVNQLTLQLLNENEATRVESLEWLIMLHRKTPDTIFLPGDGMFPALLKVLSDPSEEVVKRDLQLLAQISSHVDANGLINPSQSPTEAVRNVSKNSNPSPSPSPTSTSSSNTNAITRTPSSVNNSSSKATTICNESQSSFFASFMLNLLSMFSTDRRLLEHRGSLIIKQLCQALSAEKIFITLATILEKDKDLEFSAMMVQHLNAILLTSNELKDLRRKLRTLDRKENMLLFHTLYRCWCHSPISAFALCLLSVQYELAANLLGLFAELEVTVAMLMQVDRLIQMLESPVFTYLRLQLLEPEKYFYLYKSLYGLLMLLPQSTSFQTLKNRLACVANMNYLNPWHTSNAPSANLRGTHHANEMNKRNLSKEGLSSITNGPLLKQNELLNFFKQVQSRHEKARIPTNNTNINTSNPVNHASNSTSATIITTNNNLITSSPASITANSYHMKPNKMKSNPLFQNIKDQVDDIEDRNLKNLKGIGK